MQHDRPCALLSCNKGSGGSPAGDVFLDVLRKHRHVAEAALEDVRAVFQRVRGLQCGGGLQPWTYYLTQASSTACLKRCKLGAAGAGASSLACVTSLSVLLMTDVLVVGTRPPPPCRTRPAPRTATHSCISKASTPFR